MSVRKELERFQRYVGFTEVGRTGLLVSVAAAWIIAMRGIRVEPGRSQESLTMPTVVALGLLCVVFAGVWYAGTYARTRVRKLTTRLHLEWRDHIMANPDAVLQAVTEHLAKSAVSDTDRQVLRDFVLEVLIRFKSPRSGYDLRAIERLRANTLMGGKLWEALVRADVFDVDRIAELPFAKFSNASARAYWSETIECAVLDAHPLPPDFDVGSAKYPLAFAEHGSCKSTTA